MLKFVDLPVSSIEIKILKLKTLVLKMLLRSAVGVYLNYVEPAINGI